MILPLCTCGHTAFEHFHAAPHDCAEGGCRCSRFVPATAGPDAAERSRRYALFQAAATIWAVASDGSTARQIVADARALLAEIESREADGTKEPA